MVLSFFRNSGKTAFRIGAMLFLTGMLFTDIAPAEIIVTDCYVSSLNDVDVPAEAQA